MSNSVQLTRFRTTPVIARGSSYDTAVWVADALAAPSVCWDGTRFVLTCSAWDNTRGKWASLFFTSPDLETWTYVTGSIRAPAGSDYILGNGSIAWWGGKYWFAYSHYPSGSGVIGITLDWSTDLLSWTNVADPLIASGADGGLVANAGTGNLELWYTSPSTKVVSYQTSPDGTTWTNHANYLSSPAWNGDSLSFGEAHAYYPGDGSRQVVADVSSYATGGGQTRYKALFSDAAQTGSLTSYGTLLGPDPLNSWESVQVFDGAFIGVFDTGNGLGSQLYSIYAGGDLIALTDNTESSIGLAYTAAPAVTSGSHRMLSGGTLTPGGYGIRTGGRL